MSNTLDEREDESLQTLQDDDYSPPPPSGCRNVAMGCGCAMGVLLLIAAGLGVWIFLNWKQMASDFTKQVAADAVAKSSLPAEDKARVLKRINQLADDFKTEKVSFDQLKQVARKIAESPLLPLGMVMAADEKYLKPSGLTQKEKEDGRRALQRLARGVFEKRIPQNETQEVMKLAMERQPDGTDRVKEQLTDEELKAFLAKAKEKADAATVPDEAFEVNIADELEKAIDQVLKR